MKMKDNQIRDFMSKKPLTKPEKMFLFMWYTMLALIIGGCIFFFTVCVSGCPEGNYYYSETGDFGGALFISWIFTGSYIAMAFICAFFKRPLISGSFMLLGIINVLTISFLDMTIKGFVSIVSLFIALFICTELITYEKPKGAIKNE